MNFAPVDVGVVEATMSTTWSSSFSHLNSAWRRLTGTSSRKISLAGCRPADVTGRSSRKRDPALEPRFTTSSAEPLDNLNPPGRRCRDPLWAQRLVRSGSRHGSIRMWCVQDNQVIGMTSHAVVEARHGLILCTAWYSTFCKEADGQFLHHHPTAALRLRHRRGGMHIRP